MARRRLARALLATLVLLLLVALGVALLAPRLFGRGGLPQRAGEAPLAGLEAPVEVRFDARGVPHVRAASLGDLGAAVGWLHANDRMAQLELGRRRAAGRLAEAVGSAAVPLDLEARRLRLRTTAERAWEACGPDSRALLEGYARGVDAWVAAHEDDLPPALTLLGAPEPWTPVDSLGFALLMARDLSLIGGPDRARTRSLAEFGREGTAELFGELLQVPPGVVELPAAEAEGDANADADAEADGREGAGAGRDGSNNWAVSGARSASGTPLVANDPHLGLSLPSVWYLAHLACPGYEASGATLVGAPVVLVGQGAEVAWSVTNSGLDNNDLYLEERREDGRVRRGDAWVEPERWTETVRVRFGDPLEVELQATDVGPLWPGPDGRWASLAWTAHEPFDALAPFVALARARGLDDVERAAAAFLAPAQNLVAAHAEEGVLVCVLGRQPDRSGFPDLPGVRGRTLLPAWDPAWRWRGLAPFERALVRRGVDLAATANDDPRAPDSDLAFPGDYDVPHRARRARERLAQRDDWTPAALAELQTDTRSLYVRDVVAALGGPFAGDAERARALLAGWDGDFALDSAPAALFAEAHGALHDAVFADELRRAGSTRGGGYQQKARLLAALEGRLDADWFDDVDTPAAEDRSATVAAALARAWRRTTEAQGAQDPERWRYGARHVWTPSHPLAQLPLVGGLYALAPRAVPGSSTALAAFAGYGAVTHGPSLRWVADAGDPDAALAALPGGQSGHPRDAHYADQIDPFLRGELFPLPWSDAAVERATVSRLRLVP